MSLETTELSAAARAAGAALKAHKRDCLQCWSERRSGLLCPAGRTLRDDARQARGAYRQSAKADKEPGPGDVPLFDVPELGHPVWRNRLDCGHETITRAPGKPKEYLSCLECGAQRRIVDVSAGQGIAGNAGK